MTTHQRRTLATAMIALALLGWGTAEAGSNVVMLPAAAFVADGTAPSSYINYGYRINTGQTLHFQAWLKLPHAATITNVDMMTLDDDPGTITMYLKRTEFGSDWGTETLLTFTSPGNLGCQPGGLCHDMESLLGIEIDAVNYMYWFDLAVPDAQGTPPYENNLDFYAVRVIYTYHEVIFADGFESGNTDKWSDAVRAKVASIGLSSDSTPDLENTAAEMLAALTDGIHLDDPVALEALASALLETTGFNSPYVIPGPAFKTEGYTEYDDYYLSEPYGFVFGRPSGDGDAILSAPVILPQEAEVLYFFAFYVDSKSSGIQPDIRFWLRRMDAVDPVPTLAMVYEVTEGAETGINAIMVTRSSMESVEPGCTIIDNARYSYWATIDLGPYDGDEWHKVYAIVILYTMP